jgi:hypothetical protein
MNERPRSGDRSHRWACFGVGLNNFATGRVRFKEIRSLVAADPELDVAAAFGATGNLIIDTSLSSDEVAVRLHAHCLQATDTSLPWAVMSVELCERYANEAQGATEPATEKGIRWTRGLAFPVEPPGGSILSDTDRAGLQWTSDGRSVIVFKRDDVDGRGRLDRARRRGGWGAISQELRALVEGAWTARSLRTVKGLLKAVERAESWPAKAEFATNGKRPESRRSEHKPPPKHAEDGPTASWLEELLEATKRSTCPRCGERRAAPLM